MPGDCVYDSFEEHEILARHSNSPADHDALPFFDKSSFHAGLGTGELRKKRVPSRDFSPPPDFHQSF